MRISTVLSVVLVVLLAGSVAVVPAVAAADGSASSPQDRSTQFAVGNDSVLETTDPAQVIRINVTEGGDAVWQIESRFLLSDDEETDAFLEYAEEIRDGERGDVYDRGLFEPHVEAAEETTDREMTLREDGWEEPAVYDDGDSASDESEPMVGVLTYSFTWTGFAAVDGNRVHVGDAFQGTDGPWLSTLADDQRLVIQSPANYGFHDYNLPVSPQDSALVVDGPYQFSEGELETTFLRGAGDGATGSTGGLLPASTELFVGALVVIAAIGVAGYALIRRVGANRLSATAAAVLASDESDRADETAERSAKGDERRRGPVDSASRRGPVTDTTYRESTDEPAGQTFAYAEDSSADDADAVDLELLSDEERVLRLLRQNGGRMKQGSIVSETGWSNAKVSQLLSQMADDGDIEKLRIGRENLITLPEVDPTELD
ncbi:helix-turn-helix transcriptional regulator [Natronococcus occultus]|uniref:Uncharacterized protein n=1 Tax=Natronococcus occultus SP4 TaxID=694430 RepID=L0JYU6_9EURY|nr:hypothetical protein [Natronococcus occultus]AGB38217.1 hypothetical protein Natoc_2442 [Natronococcus occultus SP4]